MGCCEGKGKRASGASVVLSLVICFLGQIRGGGVIASFLLFRLILAQIYTALFISIESK